MLFTNGMAILYMYTFQKGLDKMKKIISVTGMHCNHCAKAVQDAVTAALESMTGVKVNSVNINVCGIIRQ